MKYINSFQRLSKKSGMTIIELLVVCLLVGVIVSISIPFLTRTKLNSNEVAAQQDLKTVLSAVEMYRSGQEPPMYPVDLAALGEGNIPILDPAIAAGRQHGYNFTLTRSADSNSYTCVANPIQPGATGTSSFCVDHEGLIKEYSSSIQSTGNRCP